MRVENGTQLTVNITDLSRGGAGIASSSDGFTIFVPYSLTGDEVKIEIVEVKRRHANARLIDIVKPSPDRQIPKCDIFTRCGGCQWQHVPYPVQWSIKIKGVHQSLAALKISTKPKLEEFPANTIWHYRNRVQMRGKNNKLGFYATRSHDIVPVTECVIARSEINESLQDIRVRGSEYPKGYKVEIEVNRDGSVASYWNERHAAGGFRQVNDEQNRNLITWVQETLKKQQPVYDLYGGSGNLSWSLAEKGIEVQCVDQSTPQNLPNQPATLYFHNKDVLSWLKNRITDMMYKHIPPPSSNWSAIIDPPRGGMGGDFEDIISRLEQLKVNNIILVGCKTDTWARDIAKLQQRDWTLDSIAAFDFFPHTPHVETTACLSKLYPSKEGTYTIR